MEQYKPDCLSSLDISGWWYIFLVYIPDSTVLSMIKHKTGVVKRLVT